MTGSVPGIAADTIFATPGGWVSGHDLTDGYQVFTSRGTVATVTRADTFHSEQWHTVRLHPDITVAATADQPWRVTNHWDGAPHTLTTSDIYRTYGDPGAAFYLPVTDPLVGQEWLTVDLVAVLTDITATPGEPSRRRRLPAPSPRSVLTIRKAVPQAVLRGAVTQRARLMNLLLASSPTVFEPDTLWADAAPATIPVHPDAVDSCRELAATLGYTSYIVGPTSDGRIDVTFHPHHRHFLLSVTPATRWYPMVALTLDQPDCSVLATVGMIPVPVAG